MAHIINPGRANFDQATKVVAGSFSTIRYVYTASHPVEDGGHIKIAFRSASDMGKPQFSRPEEDNFCSIETSADCMFVPEWSETGYVQPWGKELILTIANGYLKNGDTVELTFGDTSYGSRGWQIQTFVEKAFAFRTWADPLATFEYKPLAEYPTMNIVPGRPHRAVCIAPSIMEVNKSIVIGLRVEDRWMNPLGPMHMIEHPGFDEIGHFCIEVVDDNTGLEASSNPIMILDKMPKNNYFWADFNGQSGETCGTGSIENYFDFGRDYAGLNILAHQGCDFQITDNFWQSVKNVSDAHNFKKAGEFVTFPGFEWSGNTALGGDRSVFFSSTSCNITRSSCDLLPDKNSAHPDSPSVEDLFNNLKHQSVGACTIANADGRYANMQRHDSHLEVGIEIHSSLGTFEWLLEDAFKNSCRVGICANSDEHKGRPGLSYPGASKYESSGGLTCVLSRSLSRRDIFHAMRKRNFYATTGNRAILDLNLYVNDEPTAIMGDLVRLEPGDIAKLDVQIIGSAPVERIDLVNGLEKMLIQRTYGEDELGSRVKVMWSGAENRGRNRGVDWSGHMVIRDNRVKKAIPINFWNPDNLPVINEDGTEISWDSCTSGGLAGLILDLEHPTEGSMRMETAQGNLECHFTRVGYHPYDFDFEGLDKKIAVYRLPDELFETHFEFKIELNTLHRGDNPIFVRMYQEDGHIAWSSPIYINI